MNKTGILSRILIALFFLTLPVLSAYAQPSRAMVMVNISITCKGSYNICYSYDEGDKTVNVAGDVVSVVIDGNHSISCNPGAGAVSVGNLFLHTPGNPSTGRGYVGVEACVNPAQGTGVMNVFEDSEVYNSFLDWRDAVSGATVD